VIRLALAFLAGAACIPLVLFVEREARQQAERDRELCEKLGRRVRGWQDETLARNGGAA
jgi:hypothetical protein